MIDGRTQVLPEDIQAVLPAVAGHRLNNLDSDDGDTLRTLIETVGIP